MKGFECKKNYGIEKTTTLVHGSDMSYESKSRDLSCCEIFIVVDPLFYPNFFLINVGIAKSSSSSSATGMDTSSLIDLTPLLIKLSPDAVVDLVFLLYHILNITSLISSNHVAMMVTLISSS